MPNLLRHLTAAILLFSATATSAHAIETKATSAIMIDMDTGALLLDKNADTPMPPASMSKLMTLYMVFERLRDGRLSLEDRLPVSERAWRLGGAKTGGSTMFLEPRMRPTVEELIRGIIVQSGNDACIVVAEGLMGSEDAFADEMNMRAEELGMTGSTFRNATGWPHPEHRMTPRDLATLAVSTIHEFPEYYHYYAETEFTYNGIRQTNRNPLIYKNMGADGLKTGHTEESGYGLVSSAKRGDRRLVLVVNGLTSKKERGSESERLLEWGFREFGNYRLFEAGETVDEAPTWLGTQPMLPLVIEEDVHLTLPKKSRRKMKVKVNYTSPIAAPIMKGQQVATVTISAPDVDTIEFPLVAGADVHQLGLVGRLGAALNHILWGSNQ